MTKRDEKETPPTRRQEAAEVRRQAILDAGLDVFAARGFAAARLDDVAERAGVAKGTIYLSFKDKEDLFEQIVIGAAKPVLSKLEELVARTDLSFDALLTAMFIVFKSQVLDTKRREIANLVIAEGSRFPRIAEFYYIEVVSKIMAMISKAARRSHERGELMSDALARYPQLVGAPLILSLVWTELFSRFAPLDIDDLLATHRYLLTGKDGG